MKEEKLLFITEVIKRTGFTRPEIYRLIYEGKIKAVREGKRNLKITENSLDKYVTRKL